MLAPFCISVRSNKPAGMMSGEEESQGITVDKVSITSNIVRRLSKRHRVLADLCNHIGLEVSFHRVEMYKSVSHRIFFILLSRLNFVICQEEISSLRDT